MTRSAAARQDRSDGGHMGRAAARLRPAPEPETPAPGSLRDLSIRASWASVLADHPEWLMVAARHDMPQPPVLITDDEWDASVAFEEGQFHSYRTLDRELLATWMREALARMDGPDVYAPPPDAA